MSVLRHGPCKWCCHYWTVILWEEWISHSHLCQQCRQAFPNTSLGIHSVSVNTYCISTGYSFVVLIEFFHNSVHVSSQIKPPFSQCYPHLWVSLPSQLQGHYVFCLYFAIMLGDCCGCAIEARTCTRATTHTFCCRNWGSQKVIINGKLERYQRLPVVMSSFCQSY